MYQNVIPGTRPIYVRYTVFTAELHSIFLCLVTISYLPNPPFKHPLLIISQSSSSLYAILDIHADQRIHLLLHAFTNTPKEINFIWIPVESHRRLGE